MKNCRDLACSRNTFLLFAPPFLLSGGSRGGGGGLRDSFEPPFLPRFYTQNLVNVDKIEPSGPLSSQLLKDSCCSLPFNSFRAYTDSLVARFSPAIRLKCAWFNRKWARFWNFCTLHAHYCEKSPLNEILYPPLLLTTYLGNDFYTYCCYFLMIFVKSQTLQSHCLVFSISRPVTL